MQRRIIESHRRLAGQPPSEAELNLLETARRCELYGMKMHPAKVGGRPGRGRDGEESRRVRGGRRWSSDGSTYACACFLNNVLSVFTGPRRRSAKPDCRSHGYRRLPTLLSHQHLLLGQNKKDIIQASAISRQTAPRWNCKHYCCQLAMRSRGATSEEITFCLVK